jgi:hypothetical protein
MRYYRARARGPQEFVRGGAALAGKPRERPAHVKEKEEALAP